MVSAWCIWTGVSKSRPPTTACPRAGSDAWSKCSGTNSTFASSIPIAVCCCGNMCARNAAGIASKKKTTRNTDRCVSRSYCGALAAPALTSAPSANLIYSQLGEPGVRRVFGILSLAKKFGLAAVEEACATALEMGVYEYRFIRRYLERGPQLTLRQVDPLIRELVQYRDLINLRTQEPKE